MFYQSMGEKQAPTVVLLPGFTGSRGDLFGLAGRLNASGINALFFNYRGTRDSEGLFTPDNSVTDAVNAIRYLKSEKIARQFHIDTTRIILLGHSWGGSVALLASLHFPSVKKIVSIATTDFKVFADLLEENESFRKWHQDYLDKILSDSTLMRAPGGKESHEWLMAHRGNYDLQKRAGKLADKQILLIGGWLDRKAPVEVHMIPFYRALQRNGAENIRIKIYDTDHSFRNVHDQIFKDAIEWIRK
ncbi:MAG: alpha/beta fold hydrolase [Calditrichia bacterium]